MCRAFIQQAQTKVSSRLKRKTLQVSTPQSRHPYWNCPASEKSASIPKASAPQGQAGANSLTLYADERVFGMFGRGSKRNYWGEPPKPLGDGPLWLIYHWVLALEHLGLIREDLFRAVGLHQNISKIGHSNHVLDGG